jgi:hypothetical protein
MNRETPRVICAAIGCLLLAIAGVMGIASTETGIAPDLIAQRLMVAVYLAVVGIAGLIPVLTFRR